jgi:hypothetical protein
MCEGACQNDTNVSEEHTAYILALKIETVCSSETFLSNYGITTQNNTNIFTGSPCVATAAELFVTTFITTSPLN